MSLWRALAYFLREALIGLARSWKVSLLAVATIGVSLFLGGTVQMVTSNLAATVADWQRQARLVVYLRPGSEAAALAEVDRLVAEGGLVASRQAISPDLAVARFQRQFPSLADLFAGLGAEPLPASWELEVAARARAEAGFAAWVARLRSHPAVLMVDDDRDWLDQAERLLGLVRAAGLALSALLLGAAVFTIASVVRLILLLYREEIAVLRLVGATELFVRGPFYVQGLLQGTAGATFAVAALAATRAALLAEGHGLLSSELLLSRFLAPGQLLVLVLIGSFAGLAGAVLSVEREVAGRGA